MKRTARRLVGDLEKALEGNGGESLAKAGFEASLAEIQKLFNNKLLSLSIIMGENINSGETAEKTLSKREQYQKIIEQYPLVKELRDRPKLELDY